MIWPLLHIYGQGIWHDEVFIVGKREALLRLRDAIDSALAKTSGIAEVETADGEGYNIRVYNEEEQSYWDNASLPYSDVSFNGTADKISPWDLFGKHKDDDKKDT